MFKLLLLLSSFVVLFLITSSNLHQQETQNTLHVFSVFPPLYLPM